MIKQTIGELLGNNVVLDIEGMDRMYLNLYQPRLQTGGGIATFFREEHRGAKIASTALMGPWDRFSAPWWQVRCLFCVGIRYGHRKSAWITLCVTGSVSPT
uniref:Uncharacterized protein n=1 Tax=Candidatus Kentrum sp. FW TaxID=2126338 RepID=A0A450S7U2_9GAMM|nr:MAG: hypothetical protein BECKFW1821B_GA0114236_100357 [Candidatus Kentron sp. FW]